MTTAVIGLGSNLGSREALIAAARTLLHARASIEVLATSPFYETEPVGPPQGMFLNAAVRIDTSLTPERLLQTLLRTERRLGRVRDEDARWGPRAIDLDLLWFDGVELSTDALTIPHSRLTERPFALQPLLDVAPELRAEYASTLTSLGPALSQWGRSATTISHEPGKVVVEADHIPDALCIAAAETFRDHTVRASATLTVSGCRATRQTVTDATPAGWATALNDAIRAGFSPCAVTLGHCSESQWVSSIHGEPWRAASPSTVSVEVRPGAERTHRAILTHRQ